MNSTEREELHEILERLQNLQQRVTRLKETEQHLEKQRLLKLMDAELLDALYNLNQLLQISVTRHV